MQLDGRALWLIFGGMHAIACTSAQSPGPPSQSSSGDGMAYQADAPGGGGATEGGSPSSGGASGSGGLLDDAGSGNVADSVAAPPDAGPEVGSGTNDAAVPPFCSPGTAGNGQYTLTAGDPPEWKLMAGAAAGKVTPTSSFLSPTYGLHFPYAIYTSANYVAGRPAIFLLFGDGISMYLNGGFHAATVLDNLTAAGQVPPTVALFVDPPSDGGNATTVRVQTYDPPTDKYPTFLMTEMIPQVITGKYSISKDPDAWAVVGYSASGGQGWNLVWKRPDNFHKFIGTSASYGAANVATYGNVNWVDIIANSPKHDVRASNVTCMHDLADQRGSWLTIITNVAMALKSKGNDWRLMIGPNGHYPPVDGARDFPDSLRWMFQGCQFAR